MLGPRPSLPTWDINHVKRSSNLLWQSKHIQKCNLCALISLHQMCVYGIVRNIDLSENRTSYSENVMRIWYILLRLLVRGDYYVCFGRKTTTFQCTNLPSGQVSTHTFENVFQRYIFHTDMPRTQKVLYSLPAVQLCKSRRLYSYFMVFVVGHFRQYIFFDISQYYVVYTRIYDYNLMILGLHVVNKRRTVDFRVKLCHTYVDDHQNVVWFLSVKLSLFGTLSVNS